MKRGHKSKDGKLRRGGRNTTLARTLLIFPDYDGGVLRARLKVDLVFELHLRPGERRRVESQDLVRELLVAEHASDHVDVLVLQDRAVPGARDRRKPVEVFRRNPPPLERDQVQEVGVAEKLVVVAHSAVDEQTLESANIVRRVPSAVQRLARAVRLQQCPLPIY